MDHKIKWLLYLTGIIFIASACNLVTNFFNPVDEAVSEIEDLAEKVDIENIESEIEALATQLPSELPDIGDLDDLGDLGELDLLETVLRKGTTGIQLAVRSHEEG